MKKYTKLLWELNSGLLLFLKSKLDPLYEIIKQLIHQIQFANTREQQIQCAHRENFFETANEDSTLLIFILWSITKSDKRLRLEESQYENFGLNKMCKYFFNELQRKKSEYFYEVVPYMEFDDLKVEKIKNVPSSTTPIKIKLDTGNNFIRIDKVKSFWFGFISTPNKISQAFYHHLSLRDKKVLEIQKCEFDCKIKVGLSESELKKNTEHCLDDMGSLIFHLEDNLNDFSDYPYIMITRMKEKDFKYANNMESQDVENKEEEKLKDFQDFKQSNNNGFGNVYLDRFLNVYNEDYQNLINEDT